MKKIISVICVLFALLMVVSIPVGAAQAYTTYTYSIDGTPLYSPDAYIAEKTLDASSMGLDVALSGPSDMVTDKAGNIYIADTGNNRIVCLDRYFHFRFEIKNFKNDQGIEDYFSAPQGVFVTEDRYEGKDEDRVLKYKGRIFVCDTQASRIVTFNLDGSFDSVIEAPQSELFSENAIYWPVALAVDQYERLYVVSSETNEGIIVMTDKGEFTTFVGAQQSAISVWDQIWRRFQTEEQRRTSSAVVSYPYNNITINGDGCIYATIYAPELLGEMEAAISGQSNSGTYAPCKLLNPAGDEIMRRNGFWPPAGEIDYAGGALGGSSAAVEGISRVEDVACGPEGTWTIFDYKRSKIFTYDYDGNLLFAFCDTGDQLGNINQESIRSICYQGDVFLALSVTGDVTVFKRTEYGDILVEALYHQNHRLYDLAIDDWKEILMRNSNYDAAYIGIGQSLARSGKYEEALEYYRSAYDTENYSVAYKELRKEWMSRFFLLIPVVIVVVVFLLSKFLKRAAKINKQVSVSGKKRTFKDELYYVFHVMFHPVDGFWDLKHEKRGSVRAALVFMLITVFAFFYRAVGSGYVMNPQGTGQANIFMQVLIIFVPVLLFAVANWCLTTLFEGEGKFKDIFIAIGYSVLPIAITTIPVTLISNFMVSEELNILNLFIVLGFIWAGMLIFFGTMVTHDYTMFKNLVTIVGTVVGMAFIMFLAVLFTSLVMDMASFFTSIVSEINYRL